MSTILTEFMKIFKEKVRIFHGSDCGVDKSCV